MAEPSIKAVRLGLSLAEARGEVGLSLRDAAELIGWKHHKVHNMERGIGPYREHEIANLIGVYRVTGELRERIMHEVRTLHESVLLNRSVPELPEDAATLSSYEGMARQVTEFCPLSAPGLMQTMDYVRASMRAFGLDGGALELRLAIRAARQQRLLEGMLYTVFITEYSLRLPDVHRQMNIALLNKMLDLAGRPNVNILLIAPPIPLGVNQSGGYVLLEFDEATPLVHVETQDSVVWVTDPGLVGKVTLAAETLAAVGVDATESMLKLKRQLEGGP